MNAPGPALIEVPCAMCGSDRRAMEYPLSRGAIVRCEDCGFRFVSPRLPSAELQAKTQRWAEQDVIDAERLRIAYDPRTLALYGRHLDRMARYRQPGRLLDVGCSSGAFMHAAAARGWSAQGLEIGHASARHAALRLGVPVHRGSLYDFEADADGFDAIAFLEVIEHLEDPLGALARLSRWLRPGGVMLVSTPNYDSLFRRICGTGWWVIDCEDEHIQFFTRETLRRALHAHGLAVRWTAVRGIDLSGIWHAWRDGKPASLAPNDGYYEARERKETLKRRLSALGVMKLARAAMGGFDWLSSSRFSPLHDAGEQLVMLAVKQG